MSDEELGDAPAVTKTSVEDVAALGDPAAVSLLPT